LTLLGIVLGAFGSAGASGDLFKTLQMERFTPPRRAKPFALPTLEGKTVRLADFRGKVVFLNFWATWCPACREEMPSMERLHREFKDRGLVVLAVDLEESGDAVAKFMKEFGLTFPALLDRDGRVRDSYAVRFIPTTYLVGKDGELLGRVIGPKDWASDPARRLDPPGGDALVQSLCVWCDRGVPVWHSRRHSPRSREARLAAVPHPATAWRRADLRSGPALESVRADRVRMEDRGRPLLAFGGGPAEHHGAGVDASVRKIIN